MVSSLFKKHQIIFLFCLILGLFFGYKLSAVPVSLYADETTVGYNAYSILKTGKDEYGKEFPLLFRLFGAYTPPLYIYTLLGSISLFGLNAFSLRVISILATLGLTLVIYFLVRSIKFYRNSFGVVAALIFATAPWVYFNARIGYEVTLGYFLFYLGVLLLFFSLKKRGVLSLLGLVFLSLSTYAAHTERYLVPLFLLVFLIAVHKTIFSNQNKAQSLKNILLCSLTQIPHFYLLFTPAFWVKNQSFSSGSFSSGLWDFLNQLLIYFSPQTYFGSQVPDINLQHFIPEISLFYSWQIIPFFVGLYVLLKSKPSPDKTLVFLLLLTSPVPGAFSGHFASVQRVLPIIIPLVLIITLGIQKIFSSLPKKLASIGIFLFFCLFCVSLGLLWRSYFVFLLGQRAVWWNYGAKEIADLIKERPNQKIIIDNTRDQALYSPIIFYLKFPPEEFQKQFKTIKDAYYDTPPYSPVVQFGNAITRPINWETDTVAEAILISDPLGISPEQAKEHFLEPIKQIKDPTGKTHYNIFQTNPDRKIEDNAKRQQKQYN